ncbi:MAG: histidine phosphatase family protein [Terricaulis sp.]
MRTLTLFRHAKAERAHEAPSDEARGLTGRGRRDAEAAGEAMRAEGLAPELALVSTAQRTRETAEHGLKGVKCEFDAALYLASPEGIWDAFIESDCASVVVIGHNPGIGDLASLLVREAHDGSKLARAVASDFPTAAWAAFEVKGEILRAAGPRLLAAWRPERG